MKVQENSENTLLEDRYPRERIYPTDAKFYQRKRYLVSALVFLGWALLFLLRTNLSICIVEMTSKKSVIIGNKTSVIEAEFNWTSSEKSTILSAFSWGYFLAPLGTFITDKFGGVTTFGAGVAVTGLLTMLSPILIQWNLTAYSISRILKGAFEGFAMASTAKVFFNWTPPSERSRLIIGGTSGAVVGLTLSYPICGTIAYYWNWKCVFYTTGGATLVWYMIWLVLVRDSPSEDKFISLVEKKYFAKVNSHNYGEKVTQVTYPWKQIFKSKAIWAYVNDRFVEAWSLSFLIYFLPVYIKDVHDVNIQDIGFITAIPHFCAVVGLSGGAVVADFLRNRLILSITNVHKVYLFFAQTAAVILLICVVQWKSFEFSIICFSLFRLLFITAEVSYEVLPVDLGGPYASLILGLGTTGLSLGYTLNPIVIGLMVTNHAVAEWSRYFLLLSAFNLWGGIIFWLFGSGNLEPWAELLPATEN